MHPTLPVTEQFEILDELGVFALAGEREDEVRAGVDKLLADAPPTSALAPLLRLGGGPGFVVEDMVDVDEFRPVNVPLPDAPVYLVTGVDRGDDLRNWSPEEALAHFAESGRRPLTLHEGLSWALTQPEVIEPNACFMTIASRRVKQVRRSGEPVYDARTPALWISSGTGRDGAERRGAPKLGWCGWRNRHTWLGMASADM